MNHIYSRAIIIVPLVALIFWLVFTQNSIIVDNSKSERLEASIENDDEDPRNSLNYTVSLETHRYVPFKHDAKVQNIREFRGLRLDSHISENRDLIRVPEKDEPIKVVYQHKVQDPNQTPLFNSSILDTGKSIKAYRKKTEKLIIGDIPLENIYYNYYEDKLHSILVYYDERYSMEVMELYANLYGQPRFDGSWFSWTNSEVILNLPKVRDNTTNDNIIIYNSINVSDKIEVDEDTFINNLNQSRANDL